MKYCPHEYQRFALRWLLQRTLVDNAGGAGLFLDPGLGKTVITLAWLQCLRRLGLVKRALVVAPLRVIYSVWPQEVAKWDQFAGMTTSRIHGRNTQKNGQPVDTKKNALQAEADLHLVNAHGVPYILDQVGPDNFDAIVIDESTPFKNWTAGRTKALRKMVEATPHRVILTGTPAPHSLQDLFAQVFCVDLGERLGTAITRFRKRFFHRGGYENYSWIPNESSADIIEALIADCCLRLSAEDHLDLPELVINDVWVDLPDKALKEYKHLEKKMFLELADGREFAPLNAGSKYNACRQLANGGLYDEAGDVMEYHDAKTEALEEIAGELNGKPFMVAFNYRHDLARIRRKFPKLKSIDGSTSPKQADKLVEQWNAGDLPHLAVQPLSLSHGVNMQSGPGRDLIWYGLTDNLESYDQLNKRIYRQGVDSQVRIHRILARRTVDSAGLANLQDKSATQQSLLAALNEYRNTCLI